MSESVVIFYLSETVSKIGSLVQVPATKYNLRNWVVRAECSEGGSLKNDHVCVRMNLKKIKEKTRQEKKRDRQNKWETHCNFSLDL
jgi:hypothetical protein